MCWRSGPWKTGWLFHSRILAAARGVESRALKGAHGSGEASGCV